MAARKILVVEDESAIRDMLVFSLSRAGYEVLGAGDARGARRLIADGHPDVILVDWMLPDVSGLELTRQLKRDPGTREIPVIMVTARGEEDDRVAGLEGGADDYITKPFSARELQARIKALLRRTGPAEDAIVSVGDLELDMGSHRVSLGGQAIVLGPTEYRLLSFFIQHRERVFARSQILDRVWGGNVYVEERTVDVHIRRLRMALSSHGYDKLIQTVRGAGYRFSTSGIE
jgi:two-component system phosphate regulon response regulator PhoB